MGICLSLQSEAPVERPQVHSEPVPSERPELVLEPVPVEPIKPSKLENLDPNIVPKVPLQNEIIDARIVDIYDGDTVKIIVLLGDVPFAISLRLLGVDAPEIKKSADRLPEEHLAAVKVREYMKSLFVKNMAKVQFREWDKYGGRILGIMFTPNGDNVTDLLIKGGWVRPYNGEKKKKWTLDELTSPPFV